MRSRSSNGLSVEVRLAPRSEVLAEDGSDLVSLGARVRLVELLNSARMRPMQLLFCREESSLPLIVFVGLAILVASGVSRLVHHWLPWASPFAALLTLGMLAAAIWIGLTRTRKNVLVMSYRSGAPTWWEQHRWNLILGLLSNVLVAAVFLFIGRNG